MSLINLERNAWKMERNIKGGSKAADYKFPKSNNDMKKIFGVNDKTFYKEIKPEIIK
ncbi:hypothetical protein [Clostridium saccharoperbutylacetonicum]|uniref:hypothetical protein n=1 Tax=Clostridium saccharoperbutylacetonicum TaxID=36745 RepID=UPI001DEC6160|nr:hypothetical protein [Clostridium saccharoperbutylacetonicum]NSB34556.1 hypothetical protein [Clostridium saccharoperbutylacetonicum]